MKQEVQKQLRDFTKLQDIIKRHLTPLNDRALRSHGHYRDSEPVRGGFSLEQIRRIIQEGDLETQRELSRYFYRTNSLYRNNIDRLASLPLYDNVVIPLLDGKGSKQQIINTFTDACTFVDNLDIPNTFCHITKEWLKTGVYNGILRDEGTNGVIQDLPIAFCRTRFKDFNNLNILEFDLRYFERIVDEKFRAAALQTFPEEVQKAWREYIRGDKDVDSWVIIPPQNGGVCFTFPDDPTPLLLASIIQLKKLDDAVGREEKRDENELYKLLIQKMPYDSDGELIFELDEIAEIHASIAQMLKDVDTVDVLTVFGETTLENLQDSSAASQSSDRLEKYKDNAYNALGTSAVLFNADGSSTLAYSIKKDESLMISYLNVYETWIKYHLNRKFARTGMKFDFEILPTTVFNREDIQKAKFDGAKYGYSKMFAGVAMGIKQRSAISLMDFENDYLKMSEKMIPLQSSYTISGDENQNNAQKSNGKTSSSDLTNKGGRPELPDEQKSEKTQANIAAAG